MVETAGNPGAGLELFRRRRHEYSFIDLDFLSPPGAEKPDYKRALAPFRQVFPTAPIIVLTPSQRIREAVEAVKAGADNYLTYPVDEHEARYVADSLKELSKIESELDHLRDSFWRGDLARFVRTNSPAMVEVLDKVRSVAPTRTTVLLTGETGTGKSLMAKVIHGHSNRAKGPFVAVHCGSIPDTLVESELFGHEKGAFTGALRRKLGKFQVADGGTIFLDEIGTMTPAVQVKLLEVLQEGNFSRVGGETTVQVDVRVVAASNVDLKTFSDNGQFRKDLFYRLNVFALELPPLRERLNDIPFLAQSFLDKLNRLHGKGVSRVTDEVIEALTRYHWPGNIREMENLFERAYILEKTDQLTRSGFPMDLFTMEFPASPDSLGRTLPLKEVRQRAVEETEQRYLREILSLNQGRIEKTAAAAGITTRQLHNLMHKYGLRKEDFR